MPPLPSLNLSKLDKRVDEPEDDAEFVSDQQSPRIKSTLKTGGLKSARSLKAYTQVWSSTNLPLPLKRLYVMLGSRP
jgi:hypothetical protein